MWPTDGLRFWRIYASWGLYDLTNAAYFKGAQFGTEPHAQRIWNKQHIGVDQARIPLSDIK